MLHLWDLSGATETTAPEIIQSSDYFTFSPDGTWLVACSGGEFHFYRVGAWHEKVFTIRRRLSSDQHAPVAFTKDGRTVAFASSRYTVQLFALPQASGGEPKLIGTLESPDRFPLEMLAFSPDGRRLAAATDRQIVQLWNLALLKQGLAELNLERDWPEYR